MKEPTLLHRSNALSKSKSISKIGVTTPTDTVAKDRSQTGFEFVPPVEEDLPTSVRIILGLMNREENGYTYSLGRGFKSSEL